MNAGQNLTPFPLPIAGAHCCGGIHQLFLCDWNVIFIMLQKVLPANDRLDGVSNCVRITLLGSLARSEQCWQIRAMHLESKSPDIHSLMLWQLVNLFIRRQAMGVDRASWSSCLQALPLSNWLPALSRRLNSSWWAIICGVKVQQVHWLSSWPLPHSCF